ncbi:MAG TPA: phosphoribosyltransferase family protein [Candidatus Paceibacterota bacterium]
MNEDQVLRVLQDVGAFRAGHFAFTSGLHAGTYVNKDAIYPHVNYVSQLCRTMAEKFADDNIEVVIGPAVGAVILSTWTAHHLSELNQREVYGVYADKNDTGGFVIRRGYDKIIAGKRVLIVEDLTTTGGSIRKVVEAARSAGAEVVGAVAICNRGGVTKEAVGDPARFEALVTLHLDQWPAEQCELCHNNIPVNTDIGHGARFLKLKAS